MTKSHQATPWPFKTAENNTAEAKKPESAHSQLNVKKIVKEIIEANDINEAGLPEGFQDIDAVAFVKELARYREKSIGTPRYSNLIKTGAWGDATIANTLLQKLEEAQPEVTGKVMERAVEALQITLDYGVWGSDSFMPKLMPNGAIIIRNHHRVIGINESPSVRIKLRNVELRDELAKVLEQLDIEADDEESLIQFSIIHRLEDGTIVRTRKLPEKLSDWGQTLVLIEHQMDLSASELLCDADIASVCEHSRTGIAIIRVFADFALVYGTYRASDDFDTIVEDYCEHGFYEIDEPTTVSVSQDLDQIKSAVSSRTENRIENSDLQRPESGIMRYYFDEIMLSTRNWKSYANQKVQQISNFTPFFHESPEQPVHYYAARDPYWTLSQESGHKLAVVDVPMQAFGDIDDFEYRFVEIIESQLFDAVGFPPHRTLLLTEDVSWWQGMDCAHALDSDEARTWVKARADEMRSQFSEAIGDDPGNDQGEVLRDILIYGDTRVRIVLIFDDKPDYVGLNELMKRISGQVDGGGNLSVPHVGFCQGYDCGGYDTGNAPVLLTPAELEGEGEEQEDEYEDNE